MMMKWKGACGCAAATLALAMAAGGESLATKHFEQQKNAAATAAAAAAANAPITEIGIERSGPRRAYQAVIKADGAIEYTGIKGVERLGDYGGTVSADKVKALADFAVQIAYFNFRPTYRVPIADRTTVYTYVKAGPAEKIVMNYGDQGPSELKAFELKIEALLAQVVWVKKAGPEGQK